MTDTATPCAGTIRARVHHNALKRVTRFFASSLGDIFIETLQNARRAGATRVQVTVETLTAQPSDCSGDSSETRLTVTVTDDGAGIENPAVLLSYGENGWNNSLVDREDAAGMGILSLARRGCRIVSRPHTPDPNAPDAWLVDLAAEHFMGTEEAKVRPDDTAPYPSGTAVQFQATESLNQVHAAIAAAARHYPLPVISRARCKPDSAVSRLTARPSSTAPSMSNAGTASLSASSATAPPGYFQHDLNFYGPTVPVRLPTVETVHGGIWTVRADVANCPDLELLLPARKKAVENAFLAEMRQAAQLAIYRAMAADPAPVPPLSTGRTRARPASISRRHRKSSVPGGPKSPISTTGGTRRSSCPPAMMRWS